MDKRQSKRLSVGNTQPSDREEDKNQPDEDDDRFASVDLRHVTLERRAPSPISSGHHTTTTHTHPRCVHASNLITSLASNHPFPHHNAHTHTGSSRRCRSRTSGAEIARASRPTCPTTPQAAAMRATAQAGWWRVVVWAPSLGPRSPLNHPSLIMYQVLT